MRNMGGLWRVAALAGFACAAGVARGADPELAVTNLATMPARDVARLLVGCGITEIMDARYSGPPQSIGMFTTSGVGAGIIGFASGLVLSTGNSAGIRGANTVNRQTTSVSSPSDDDLTAIGDALNAPAGIRTGALLQFDFIPSGTLIEVEYTLGSEEWPEFTCSNYDVIGIILNGVNLTYLPVSATTYVGITTVSSGELSGTTYSPCSGTACAGICGSEYFINNIRASGTLSGSAESATRMAGTQMDGLIRVMTARGPVTPGVINRLKFVMGGDLLDDSNFFIQIGSLRSNCTPGPAAPTAAQVPATPAVEASPRAYPNPFRPGSGGGQDAAELAVDGLPAGAAVRFYTVRGALVAELAESGGRVLWDGMNQRSGTAVASGVYVVVIEAPDGARTRRKIVVAR